MITISYIVENLGVTPRALHYYAEIGLLKPISKGKNKTYEYNEEDIHKLQKIVALKELGFTLNEIKIILNKKDLNLVNLLEDYKLILEKKRNILTKILESNNEEDYLLKFLKEISDLKKEMKNRIEGF
ncbi:MerR family transcriptional regulator [Priestia megaterium]